MKAAVGARRVDAVVVGAGATGAACAAFLAEAGLEVLCVEQRGLASAGARWINGVPRAAFTQAHVSLPTAPETDGEPRPFHLSVGPESPLHDRPRVVTIVDHDVIHVDMRHLVQRLHDQARRSGVQFLEQVKVHGWDGQALDTSIGSIEARWVVDASGLAGARLLAQPTVPRGELCAAAQRVLAISDRAGAFGFLDRFGARPGESVGFVGVAGGYSVLNVHVAADLESIGVLTGSIPALGYPSGKQLLDRFVAAHSWIGAARFGGAAAIPLRRPYDRLADDRVALVGDAACQVFPAHGSGVGAGLIAARLLAETIISGRSLRDYEVTWQRRHGGLLASFDAFRRWTQLLDSAAVTRLFTSGLATSELLTAGLNQEPAQLSWSTWMHLIPRLGRALLTDPILARGLARAGVRSKLVGALYAHYPRDGSRVALWGRAVDRLLGS
jgi:menaquinone-9 beta-reductase